MKSIYKSGDIYLTDSDSTGAKIVKFLMTSPTIYHHLFWWITGYLSKERPRFYHAGMILNDEQIIEQQSKVKISSINKIFKNNFIVLRNKHLTEQQKNKLVEISMADLGEGYGITECIGKLIAWLTGIQIFARLFDMKDRAICVIRVAEWYKEATGIDFGVVDPDYLTTKAIDVYCQTHPNDWEVIDIKLEEEK